MTKFAPWTEIKRFTTLRLEFSLFLSFAFIRIFLLFFGPWFTTDLERSLFYGKHFWNNIFFDVYALTPFEIDPNFNVIDLTTGLASWPGNTFDYPVLSILLFSNLALIPGDVFTQIVIAKLVFSFVDFINFVLIRQLEEKKLLSWLYWIVLTPFSALEGQPVSITILFFLIAIWAYKTFENKSFAFILVALGFHWKYVSLLLLPLFILDSFNNSIRKQTGKPDWKSFLLPIISFLIVFSILWFPLLVSPYIIRYISLGGNLSVGDTYPWNPFYLGMPWTIAGFLLLLLIGFSLYHIFIQIRRDFSNFWIAINFLPIFGLWGFLLIYKYAFPWYWMWAVPLFIIIPSWQKQKILYAYVGICIIASIEFFYWTAIVISGII